MATITQGFDADVVQFRPGTAFPEYVKANGTYAPVTGLAFDATTEESCFMRTQADNYGSGAITVKISWYAKSATSGGVSFGVNLAAQTANTDNIDTEGKGFATEVTISDTHLGTTGKRPHDVIGTISGASLDSLSLDDWLTIKLSRKPTDAGDTMTGDAIVTRVKLSYSDT